MAILTPGGPNLAFQTPDIWKGANAFAEGLESLGKGLDKRRLNKERDAFNRAIAGGEEAELEAEMEDNDRQIAEYEAKLGGG